jgi:AraC-like DNA-binding protein
VLIATFQPYRHRPSNLADLDLFYCGKEACQPGHTFSAVRDHYLIHYITAGRGVFRPGNAEYHLRAGDGFLICPGIPTSYSADMRSPWHYCWFGFHGRRADEYLALAGLTAELPIFTHNSDTMVADCIEEMLACARLNPADRFRSTAALYRAFSCLARRQPEPAERAINNQALYVREALRYVERNFSRPMHVSDIADYIGIDRSYLYLLFKKHTSLSPQEYLISFRMTKAGDLLLATDLPIVDIARSVGYEDSIVFTKAFKKHTGSAPTIYRKKTVNPD